MGVIEDVAKYTIEELNRIQEQYQELIEGPEEEPVEANFEEEAHAQDDVQEDEQQPS